MSEPRTLDAVVDALAGFQPRLLAVVDPAREPAVLEWLRASGLAFQCLFQGEKAEQLADEAPYLVDLGRERARVAELVQAHHDDGVVSYLVSDAPFYVIRRHLRRIQMIRTEDGETLFFRYYDPRILRAFLPSCIEEQIPWMFGGVVDRWLTEAYDEGELLEMVVFEPEGEGPRAVLYNRIA